MFTKHVEKQLSAYLHGELSPENSRRVAEHLRGCERCRREYDEIIFGAQLAEQLPTVTAPAQMWSEIEAMLDRRAPDAQNQSPVARRAFTLNWIHVAVASAAIIIIAATSLFVFRQNVSTTEWQSGAGNPAGGSRAWEVESLAGTIKVGGDPVSGEGQLKVGQTLETTSTSRARVNVSTIGNVELEPNSRIRLLETKETEHRLALDRGTMHAMISAPPRLFFVDTPSGEAIDYGCAYTLEVDDRGRSHLRVTMGLVMLANSGRESYVYRGFLCETRPGTGPGTPYSKDASQSLVDALSKFDFDSPSEQYLAVVLKEARAEDALTVWHLIQRVSPEQRAEVVDRMIALVGLPGGVSRDGVMNLDKNMLEAWRNQLNIRWF